MNRMFLLMQPKSKSYLYCTTCNHLYDINLEVCTCWDKSKQLSTELIESGFKPHFRNIIPFKQYIKEKYGGK